MREQWLKNEPEDGKNNSEPYRDGMHDDTEARVEPHESNSRQTVSGRSRIEAVDDVEAECERQIERHGESIGHCKSSEDTVGCRHHVPLSQHYDVERVGDDAERADRRCQVTMVMLVPVVQLQ